MCILVFIRTTTLSSSIAWCNCPTCEEALHEVSLIVKFLQYYSFWWLAKHFDFLLSIYCRSAPGVSLLLGIGYSEYFDLKLVLQYSRCILLLSGTVHHTVQWFDHQGYVLVSLFSTALCFWSIEKWFDHLHHRSTSSGLSLPHCNISSTLDRTVMALKMVSIILHLFTHIEKLLKTADSILGCLGWRRQNITFFLKASKNMT